MVGTYLISELYIKIEYNFDTTTEFLKNYKVNSDKVDFLVSVSLDEVNSSYESKKEIPLYLHETLCIYGKICKKILTLYNGLLFHASAVCIDGNGYIFTAPSGTGKSTHTAYLKELLGDRFKYINDDKPLLRFNEKENCFYVYGTPWDGKHHRSENIKAPLKAVCFITRGEPKVIKIDVINAIPLLMEQTMRWHDDNSQDYYLEMLNKLSQSVDFYAMKCTNHIDSAKYSYENIIKNYK